MLVSDGKRTKKVLGQFDLTPLISLTWMTSFEFTLLEFHAIDFKIIFISRCYVECCACGNAKTDIFDKFYPVLT